MTSLSLWSARLSADGPVRTVTLAGELDYYAADELCGLLVEQIDQPGTDTVVAGLADVSFLDSAALGALIQAFQHAGDTGRAFRITEPRHTVLRVLQITGMADILAGRA